MSPARRSTKRKRKPATPPSKSEPVRGLPGDRSQRLGTKHLCFACGTKFYDLNRPEPICPKCETNQLERPKEPVVKPLPPEPARPKPASDMTPLLEEEEEVEETSFGDDDVDVELGSLEGGDTIFDDDDEVADDED